MTADFRALCAELVDDLELWVAFGEVEPTEESHALIDRVRAALAQPEPVEATDEELLKTYCDARRAFYFEAAEGESDQEDRKAATIAGLRAAISRYARPTIEPVPVSERLPGPEDCDAEERCWWFSPPACGPHKIRPCWTLDSEVMEGDSHWLPHHALPVPSSPTLETP
jgi:hypothetical protein